MLYCCCMKQTAVIPPTNDKLDTYYERNARLNGMSVQSYKIKMREDYIITRYYLRKNYGSKGRVR